MRKFKCEMCGYIHDEAENGDFDSLGDDYVCPICGAPKELFNEEENNEKNEPVSTEKEEIVDDVVELDNLEISAVLSNLARGCEKQYMLKEAESFRKISDYFNKEKQKSNINQSNLLDLINEDLSTHLKDAVDAAVKYSDRGAQRALTWSSKVTNILKVLLEKYYNDDLENTKVYVCTICGFISISSEAPLLCPVCKVQQNKFVEVKEN